MVSLFGWKLTKVKTSASPISGYELDDMDRLHATQTKQLRAEMKKIQQEIQIEKQKFELDKLRAEQEQLRQELFGDDEEDEEDEEPSPEALFLPILLNAFKPGQQPAQEQFFQQQAPSKEQVQLVQYTDNEIREIMNKLPKKYIKLARNLDDNTIRKFIHSHQPGLNPETVDRALKILRE